jgi:hypothetical protein
MEYWTDDIRKLFLWLKDLNIRPETLKTSAGKSREYTETYRHRQ